jgi:hypothetical protein
MSFSQEIGATQHHSPVYKFGQEKLLKTQEKHSCPLSRVDHVVIVLDAVLRYSRSSRRLRTRQARKFVFGPFLLPLPQANHAASARESQCLRRLRIANRLIQVLVENALSHASSLSPKILLCDLP